MDFCRMVWLLPHVLLALFWCGGVIRYLRLERLRRKLRHRKEEKQ